MITTTIDYSNDPLYRLTAADYDSGEIFHYSYDPVGNRLRQETHINSNLYDYDAANRMVEVDGVTYAWDANGNLLNDGLRTYTYDHAGRLSSIVQGSDVYTFAYSGLGDRLRQTVNGVASDYTLDIVPGLTQVLTNGTEMFLYGVDRVAQQGIGGREYFLGDALNSARQLVNSAGQTRLGRSYEPFGDLLSIAGGLKTSYGFAGEWADATGLIHLRARYYQPTDGRFVQPDPFAGVPTKPVSLNPYPYAYDNPLTYTDASGRNPVLALATGIAGGIAAGVVAGALFGALTYNWALAGECGCDKQEKALSMTRWDWIGANALAGGILGGVFTAVAAMGPLGLIVVGGAGVILSVADFVKTVDIILYETGLTLCTAVRLLIDVVVFSLGIGLIVKGVQAWQASGRLLSLGPPRVSTPADRATHIIEGDGTGTAGRHAGRFGDPTVPATEPSRVGTKTYFPRAWSDADIISAAEEAARITAARRVYQDWSGNYLHTAVSITRNAVTVLVQVVTSPAFEVWTAWPIVP